ncbi:MAG: acyltransferase family protein [Prevotella sp.]|nr:acyltransferase family protein [Alistipes senegalensis]MCM1358006.1 acyltransferase family protein [Prevotella sp.]
MSKEKIKDSMAVSSKNPPTETVTEVKEIQKKPVKPYYAGIDIVKILAMFMVICIHTYLHDGMYGEPITDSKFIIPIAFRWLSYTCVPLFMICTGYLMKNKKISGKYYLGLVKIIVIYIIISIICMKFNHDKYGTDFSDKWKVLKGFLEYSNANYAWYVNYYIAIFLCIPFLNLAFNGLETKKQKFILVVTSAALTVFARSLFIGFERDNQIRLLPDYLNGAWSFAYYFAGAYIREYPPKRNLKNKLLIFIGYAATLFVITGSTYAQSLADVDSNNRFVSWHFNDYGTYPVYLLAVFTFMLLFDITTKNKVVKFILRQLSGVTFGTYLISYVFDAKNYGEFNEKYPVVYDRWSHAIEIVGKNFLCALVCGLVIHNLYNLCEFLIKKLIEKIKSGKADVIEE